MTVRSTTALHQGRKAFVCAFIVLWSLTAGVAKAGNLFVLFNGIAQPIELIGFEISSGTDVGRVGVQKEITARLSSPEIKLTALALPSDSPLLHQMATGRPFQDVRIQVFGGPGPNGIYSEWVLENVWVNSVHHAAGLNELKPLQTNVALPMPRVQLGLAVSKATLRYIGSNNTILSQFCYDYRAARSCS